RRGAAAVARPLAARLPAPGRRLGQGRGRQHRLLADRRAPAVPRHVPISLSGGRALSRRRGPPARPGALPDPPRPPSAAPVARTGGGERMMRGKLVSLTVALFLALLVNTAYIAAFADPTIFYMGNVLVHFLLGLALAVAVALLFRRRPELGRELAVAAALFTLALVAGIWLAVAGNTMPNRWLLWIHVGSAGLAVAALIPWVWRKAAEGEGWRRFSRAFLAAVLLLAVLPAATALYRRANPDPRSRIVNPLIVPTSMHEEGEGPKSPFFPSSARTNDGDIIPSNFFMDSA